jgi:hypothetical protein
MFSAWTASAIAQQAAPVWQPHVDVEAKPGSKRNIGEADFFLPLMQDGKGLFFGNARLRVSDHDNHEGNLGLGYRRMLEGGWNVGGYGYFDRRRTEVGNKFNQATFGAEALGRDWDFRGNVYVPVGDKAKNTGAVSSTASLSGTTVQVVTTPFEERALKGYDIEAGWRAPIWAAEADQQLRLYAGGYRFSDSGTRVSGPRVRAELTVAELPALWKGAQLMLGAEYQDDNARGGQGFVSARLRIPLGSDKAPGYKMNWQQRRMAAPVVRDVDIVTRTALATSQAVTETATQTASGQALSVLTSGTTDGAAFQTALATAGPNSTVVLSGNFTTTTQTTLQAGQTVAGGGVQVRTPSGVVATLPSTGATWTGNNIPGATYTVAMANNSTLQGMTIIDNETAGGGNAQGVMVNGVTGARIIDNVINVSAVSGSTGHGIDVVGGATNITVSGNRINVSTGNTLGLGVQLHGAGTSGTVSNNTIVMTGAGSVTGIFVTTNATAVTTGNRVDVTGTGGIGATGFRIDNATAVIANSTIRAS